MQDSHLDPRLDPNLNPDLDPDLDPDSGATSTDSADLINPSQAKTQLPAIAPDIHAKSADQPLPMGSWRFWLPMLMQAALIIAVPTQSAITYATGTTVTLKTVPVDPYDFLRGYSQTLRYEISNPEVLANLPGGPEIFQEGYQPTSVYVILEAPALSSEPPVAWQPKRVSRDRPASLPANQIALRGYSEGWQVVYGLETYYMPEDQRQSINQQISQVQRSSDTAFVVEIKVDDRGKSVPVSLWVSDRQYRF
ncbi:GDYXXLXY domain-containing protein [Lyngbya confervoides]|uniref:GDYXXLXY domain-containing protein n=1 Tax=Lyngbya confervoides BDU141951 TaxID=1574623 RepID=A0ABD4SYU4_9CYAN|nr:GDYXXLXY domain-containing protein [Lyngbya confervoides]MCM1981449.1 GDYXXLXY domain-containing protein [Lyngbya confervoides BDU141951]